MRGLVFEDLRESMDWEANAGENDTVGADCCCGNEQAEERTSQLEFVFARITAGRPNAP